MNFLFVDDDKIFSEKCISILLSYGYDVKYAENSEEAKCLLYRIEFDIVIIDLMLPPTYSDEGLNLLKYIKHGNLKSICLMITTKQQNTTEIVAECMKTGAYNFLDKGNSLFYSKLRTSIQEITSKMKNNIFLSYGHNELLKLKIKEFIQERLKRKVFILADQPSRGLTVVEKLENISNYCNCAVILMTKDDYQLDNGARTRQNVVHEIGFFQGKYGRNNVILVAESGVEIFSNISGIMRLDFEKNHFNEVLESLRIELEVI
jgi:predicted nucleotide-binding protein